MKTVLLTRSEEQNRFFNSGLAESDVSVLSKPLLQFSAYPFTEEVKKKVIDLDRFDHIVFVSQNAVRYGLPHLQDYWPQWPEGLMWYAVGPATALRLGDWNISAIVPETASSEGLLALKELTAPEKVLIVRGVGGRELLRESLISRGAEVDYLEVYQRILVPYQEKFDLDADSEIIVTIYSGEAMKRCAELIDNLECCTLVVPSMRLQTMAFEIGFDKVCLAASQHDEAMLETILQVISGVNFPG